MTKSDNELKEEWWSIPRSAINLNTILWHASNSSIYYFICLSILWNSKGLCQVLRSFKCAVDSKNCSDVEKERLYEKQLKIK